MDASKLSSRRPISSTVYIRAIPVVYQSCRFEMLSRFADISAVTAANLEFRLSNKSSTIVLSSVRP